MVALLIRLASQPSFVIGALLVEPSTRQITLAGQTETIEPRVMQVLVALTCADGAVVSRDDLVASCWDGRIVGDDSIHRAIYKVRDIGERFGCGAFRIETIAKVGFRLIPTDSQRMLPSGIGRILRATAPHDRRPRWWPVRLPILVGLAGLALVAAFFVGWRIVGHDRPPATQTGRVDVVRFEARRDDPELQRLSLELRDSFVSRLSRSGVEVVPQVEGRGGNENEAAAELRVTGSVDRQGEDLVVNTQVLDRKSRVVLLSLQLKRPAASSTDFADQIALRITSSLDGALEDRKQSRRAMDPSVLALYLNTLDTTIQEGNPQRGLEFGRRLITAAPDLAIGYAIYGIAQARVASLESNPTDVAALQAAARESAAHALKLDPRTPKAYIAIAHSYPSRGHWVEREKALLMARQIDPNLNPGQITYLLLLQETGRVKAALDVANRLVASGDPRTLTSAETMATQLNAQLGNMEAVATLLSRMDPRTERGSRLMIASYWEAPAQGLAHLRALGPVGMRPSSFACAEKFLEELPGRVASHAHGLPALCDDAPRERRLNMLMREGDLEGAYTETSKFIENPDAFLGPLFGPDMKALRADPRFLPLMQRLGLLDYWLTTGHWPDFCAEPNLPYDCRKAALALKTQRDR